MSVWETLIHCNLLRSWTNVLFVTIYENYESHINMLKKLVRLHVAHYQLKVLMVSYSDGWSGISLSCWVKKRYVSRLEAIFSTISWNLVECLTCLYLGQVRKIRQYITWLEAVILSTWSPWMLVLMICRSFSEVRYEGSKVVYHARS